MSTKADMPSLTLSDVLSMATSTSEEQTKFVESLNELNVEPITDREQREALHEKLNRLPTDMQHDAYQSVSRVWDVFINDDMASGCNGLDDKTGQEVSVESGSPREESANHEGAGLCKLEDESEFKDQSGKTGSPSGAQVTLASVHPSDLLAMPTSTPEEESKFAEEVAKVNIKLMDKQLQVMLSKKMKSLLPDMMIEAYVSWSRAWEAFIDEDTESESEEQDDESCEQEPREYLVAFISTGKSEAMRKAQRTMFRHTMHNEGWCMCPFGTPLELKNWDRSTPLSVQEALKVTKVAIGSGVDVCCELHVTMLAYHLHITLYDVEGRFKGRDPLLTVIRKTEGEPLKYAGLKNHGMGPELFADGAHDHEFLPGFYVVERQDDISI